VENKDNKINELRHIDDEPPDFALSNPSISLAVMLRTAAGELLSTDAIARRVIAGKGFDAGDAILRAAIREQVGSTVKRLHRDGTVELSGRGRGAR
jgi:hypothetical protein